MRPQLNCTTYLRIAAVLTMIHAILHTIGGVFGKPQPGAATAAFTAMQSHRFLMMGHLRTYAGFYVGFGLAVTIFLTVLAILFWMLGSLAKHDAARLKPILWTCLAAFLVLAVNSYAYFFSGPVVAELLIAACLGGAIHAAGSQEPAPR